MLSDLHPDQDDIWALGSSPIKTSELAVLLSEYPLKQTADYLLNGFTHDFKINYEGQRNTCEYRNLLSVIQNPINAQKNLNNEIHWGEWLGHFAINLFQICVVLR